MALIPLVRFVACFAGFANSFIGRRQSVLRDIQVVPAQWMPTKTVRLFSSFGGDGGIRAPRSSVPDVVFTARDRFKVRRVDTVACMTEVVNRKSIGDRANHPFVGKAMNEPCAIITITATSNSDLPISTGERKPLPKPTLAVRQFLYARPKSFFKSWAWVVSDRHRDTLSQHGASCQ